MMHGPMMEPVARIAERAGAAIMEVYERADLGTRHKRDSSPVTDADMAAHHIIKAALAQLTPDIHIISEEGSLPPPEVRRKWPRHWLVDPLDGTREFVKRNGEFTVNIALIEDGRPVLGVVYAPVRKLLYSGAAGVAAMRHGDGRAEAIRAAPLADGRPLRLVASRSHGHAPLVALKERLRQRFGALDVQGMGSSLKICAVAEGRADIYPRLGPTSEWDTAAAQAVLEAAGGALLRRAGARLLPLAYNKDDILNPWFYALGDRSWPWHELLCGGD